MRDARRLAAVRAHDHDLAEPEWHRLLDDPALLILGRVGLGVVFGDVHAGDDHGLVARPYFLDAAALPAVLARDDHDLVAFAKAHATSHQRTSGASETIFMKLRSRSSRATGPKIRVPRGWFWGFKRTAALSSKRMYDPSVRRYSLVWRTTTARTTSPFFTPEFGIAFFTAAMKTSPISAVVPVDEASTRITESSRAPVLSAQRTRVYGRITLLLSPLSPARRPRARV